MSQGIKTALIGLLAFAAGIMSSRLSQTTASAEEPPNAAVVASQGQTGQSLLASGEEDLGILWKTDGEGLRFTATDPTRSFLIFGSPIDINDGLEAPDLTFVFDETRTRNDEPSMVFEMIPIFDCSDVCLPCLDVGGCIDPRPPPDRGPIRWQASWMNPSGALPYDPRAMEDRY